MKKTLFLLIAILGVTTVFAQMEQMDNSKMKHETATSTNVVKYTCPMHPEVVSDKPGKCPKCGMNLVEKKVGVSKTYTCPMHPEVISDKPGKCPKCGMKLVPVNTDNKEKGKKKSMDMSGDMGKMNM